MSEDAGKLNSRRDTVTVPNCGRTSGPPPGVRYADPTEGNKLRSSPTLARDVPN